VALAVAIVEEWGVHNSQSERVLHELKNLVARLNLPDLSQALDAGVRSADPSPALRVLLKQLLDQAGKNGAF
jgi:hypothetical protein